jgi:hypothetical protein
MVKAGAKHFLPGNTFLKFWQFIGGDRIHGNRDLKRQFLHLLQIVAAI